MCNFSPVFLCSSGLVYTFNGSFNDASLVVTICIVYFPHVRFSCKSSRALLILVIVSVGDAPHHVSCSMG